MTYNSWDYMKLSEAIDINPRTPLKKGTIAKKISMQDLEEFNKKIRSYELSEFKSGGSKFQNGDTLLARITPSLENGKTAFVDILEDGEIGFGSTEFLVLRAKQGITDEEFIYYLSISPKFREIAIKSMTGTTGRQRVQADVLKNSFFKFPPLWEQKQIAKILSVLDEKIELNNQINLTIEEIAKTIFEHWFVDFEFPNENGEPYKSSGGKLMESEIGSIPKNWQTSNLNEIIFITSGKRPKLKSETNNQEFCYPLIGASSQMGFVNDYLYDEKILIIGRVGTLGVVQRFIKKCWPSDNTLVIKSDYYNYVYQILKNIDYSALNRGSTQPLLTQTDIKNYKIIIPEHKVLQSYEKITGKLFEVIEKNKTENATLIKLRDTLLPKLMSGEIRVPEAEQEVEACLQKNS